MKAGECNFTENLEFFKWESEDDTSALIAWCVARENYVGQTCFYKRKTLLNPSNYDVLRFGAVRYLLQHPSYFVYQKNAVEYFRQYYEGSFDILFTIKLRS